MDRNNMQSAGRSPNSRLNGTTARETKTAVANRRVCADRPTDLPIEPYRFDVMLNFFYSFFFIVRLNRVVRGAQLALPSNVTY